MKVLFDYAAFVMQKHGGVSRVLYELAVHLEERPDVECRIFAGFHKNEYLKQAPKPLRKKIVGWSLPAPIVKMRIFFPINRFLFRIYVGFFKPDICHLTYFEVPPVPRGSKVVITVHDMIHELFPEIWSPNDPQRGWKKNAIAAADGIVCVSANTRQDLERLYNVDGKEVEVIHHGNSMGDIAPADPHFKHPFILFVGTRSVKYKNFNLVLDALAKADSVLHLVCFGGGGFRDYELSRFKELSITDRVHQVGGDDAVLAGYYSEAKALVYPSTYEGFGLPPIEAMGAGCPVLASSAPPMPEVIGEAGLYFDPNSPESLVLQIARLNDSNQRQSLISAGYKQVQQFTWENSAAVAERFYHEINKA